MPKNNSNINVVEVAKIARISIPVAKISDFQDKLDSVVEWVSQAYQLDASKFEPMFYVNISTNRTYNNDNNIKAEPVSEVLYNNKIQAQQFNTPTPPHEYQSHFQTILVVE